MRKNAFLWIIISYFILNIFNTYFLCIEAFNKYILAFDHTVLGNIFSILGNFAVLGLFLILGLAIFKTPKRTSIYLLILSLILNVAIITIQYYNKGYKIAFSFFNFSLMKNPSGGFGSNVVLDWLYELFVNFRIVNLLPFAVILAIMIFMRKNISKEKIQIKPIKHIIGAIALILIQITSYAYYQVSMDKNWGYSTEYAQYGIQNCGAYNYYVSEILQIDNRNIKNDKTIEERYEDISIYNKNKNEYVNIIDGKTYSNVDKQTGILKDKNVFVIQLESTMTFCFEQSYNDIEITPYFNKLFKDENCFFFNDAYTSTGIGNTSDAELTFFTGYYPTGDMTLAWEYKEHDFDLTSIVELLGDEYKSFSYNGTNEEFYNHNTLHEELYGITNFRGLESFKQEFPRKDNEEKYFNYWISDHSILNWAANTAKENQKNGNKSFSFVETITPHNPFPDYSDQIEGFTKDYGLSSTNDSLHNYISMVNYDDKLIYDFLMDVTNPESENYLENTVFILYGDHGNTLAKDAYEDLFNRELSDLEYRRMILNIPIIFYDPSGAIKNSVAGDDIETILSQTKSNTDMFRTVINMFGLETNTNYYGVNLFSGEPTYTYDPKNFIIMTDEFVYCEKNGEYEVYDDSKLNRDLIDHVLDFRMKQDDYLNTLVYSSPAK